MGAKIRRGDLTKGFLCYNFGAFVFGGGLFLEFYSTTFRTYLHSHWLIDVCFGMLNAVLMSPLGH